MATVFLRIGLILRAFVLGFLITLFVLIPEILQGESDSGDVDDFFR